MLTGYTRDKYEKAIAGAVIELKDDQFRTIYQTQSDEKGFYSLNVPAGIYPFLTAVRDYAEQYLEYWCHNIDLSQDRILNICFDTLEIYGLHVFQVKGAYPSLMAYFRPMSLEKWKNGDTDICPDIKSIRVFVNAKEVSILEQSRVIEFIGDRRMGAYLIQVAFPANERKWDRFDVEIRDSIDSFGKATLFSDSHKPA